MRNLKYLPCLVLVTALTCGVAFGAAAEWNPVGQHPSIGPEADRLLIGFKATDANSSVRIVKVHSSARNVHLVEAQTSAADALGLAQRAGMAVAGSRQIAPSLHVLFLQQKLFGAKVTELLARLRADQAVAFADVDEHRYAHALPNDPLFYPGGNSSGQWYMQKPTAGGDASATDAVSAWDITKGSSGTIIADVDSGFRFDHPDLLRAGFGGRLLPGYDFVGGDLNKTNGASLGTFLIANDGDGWDPDPSDPGDWINAADQMNTLFPKASCPVEDSSWHGTRVAGVLGAITDNNTGIAGMTWNPYILPVRGLGKCGGYDSDIQAGIRWAVGMEVSGVVANPYPADIVNLSLGGSGSCPSSYQSLITTLATMGVLVVASAGNESGPVDSPGNCSGVLAVAGLRNIGTKVGYSSLGPEVGIAAPAGNCVNSSGACLRSIDTTVNAGSTTPTTNTYTNELEPNLGTSFSAPIVSATAALMRAVNANLTPAQLITRIKSSSTPFPPAPAGLPTCPATDPTTNTGECACVPGQCGAGMLNAFSAVQAAQHPIAAVAVPKSIGAGSTLTFDGSGSAPSCNRTIASYAWSRTGGVAIQGGTSAATVAVTWTGSSGTLTLIVTDSTGATDTAVVNFSTSAATTAAPATAGNALSACPTPMTVVVASPTVATAFVPGSVATSTTSVLTLTLSNSNPFALTQTSFTHPLPAGLSVETSPPPSTTCAGAGATLRASGGNLILSDAIIPANGSCKITLPVMSSGAGAYTDSVAANSLSTGPGGANADSATATLTVTAPVAAGHSGGGGALGWMEILFGAALLLGSRLRRYSLQ